MSKVHQQKEPPYRKTLPNGQFPVNIISTSTSRNTNIVFKLCSKNWWRCSYPMGYISVLGTSKLNKLGLIDVINLILLTINILKNQLILGFVYHNVVQFSHWEILQTRISLPQYLIKTSLKSPIKAVLLDPLPNLALLFNQFNNSFSERKIYPGNVVNSR